MNEESLLYQLSISQIQGIGIRIAKQLIEQCGSAKAVFEESIKTLSAINGINYTLAKSIKGFSNFRRAEEEINFINKNKITCHFYKDDAYPFRLKFCADGPLLLFGKGNINWNPTRSLSVVGTRKMSHYGRSECDSIIKDLSSINLNIISGLAFGVDICAHRAALRNQVPTVAVVAHGLDRLYPSIHRNTVIQMLDTGGIITEFLSGTIPDRENFPKRNRIIAGMSDATLVIESGPKGGSMSTAEIAASYNRDVFAVPGNNDSTFSEGCNYLIHTQKAGLIRNANDIKKIMNWQDKKPTTSIQTSLFVDLNEEEKKLVTFLHHKGSIGIDDLCIYMSITMQKMSVMLLNLEFKGLVQSLPGKVYKVL